MDEKKAKQILALENRKFEEVASIMKEQMEDVMVAKKKVKNKITTTLICLKTALNTINEAQAEARAVWEKCQQVSDELFQVKAKYESSRLEVCNGIQSVEKALVSKKDSIKEEEMVAKISQQLVEVVKQHEEPKIKIESPESLDDEMVYVKTFQVKAPMATSGDTSKELGKVFETAEKTIIQANVKAASSSIIPNAQALVAQITSTQATSRKSNKKATEEKVVKENQKDKSKDSSSKETRVNGLDKTQNHQKRKHSLDRKESSSSKRSNELRPRLHRELSYEERKRLREERHKEIKNTWLNYVNL